MGIDETTGNSSWYHPRDTLPGASASSVSMKERPGLSTDLSQQTASTFECVTALHKESIDQSEFLDLFCKLHIPSCTCSSMAESEFHIFLSIEWNCVHLRL
jgi:hypothetical protein